MNLVVFFSVENLYREFNCNFPNMKKILSPFTKIQFLYRIFYQNVSGFLLYPPTAHPLHRKPHAKPPFPANRFWPAKNLKTVRRSGLLHGAFIWDGVGWTLISNLNLLRISNDKTGCTCAPFKNVLENIFGQKYFKNIFR